MKKALLLGGSHFQIPSIKKAKELGYYAITCDYLPNNPGHKYADEYYNVSTTDKDDVLALAQRLNVDGIICYASDPGAPTAAYVSEKMGLASNPYEAVEILSNKELFREFLEKHSFNTPKAKGYSDINEAKADISGFKLPVYIKPVDSSGSKGVSILINESNLDVQIEEAIKYSKIKRFIIEEYIENDGYQISGDGFSVDGKLVFRCFNNQHYEEKVLNPFIPVGISYPCIKPNHIQTKIHNEIQRLFDLLNIRSSAYNFEIRVSNDDVWIVEIGARNGGNLVPQITKYATGVDLVDYTVKAAMGEDCSTLKMVETKGYWGNYKINSQKSGKLKEVFVDEEFKENNLVEYHQYYEPGDEIPSFTGTNGILGIVISRFKDKNEMLSKMDNMKNFINTSVY